MRLRCGFGDAVVPVSRVAAAAFVVVVEIAAMPVFAEGRVSVLVAALHRQASERHRNVDQLPPPPLLSLTATHAK